MGQITGKQRPHGSPRRIPKRLSRRLPCPSCLRGKGDDPLQEQEEEIIGGPQLPHLDQWGSGEQEVIQITVEDLGIVNSGFSLFDDDPVTSRAGVARSASSVSACQRALKKRRVRPLSSLPIQPHSDHGVHSTSGEDDEDEDDDQLLFESGTESTPASGSLRPVINLIPPTPSDVADDDQFFDVYSEESVAHTTCSDGGCAAGDQESCEEKMEEETEELAQTQSEVNADTTARSGERREEAVQTKEEQKERMKTKFSFSDFQVAPLPEYRQKRSYNTGINLLSFTEHNLDDLSSREVSCTDMLKANLCLPPHTTNMDTFTHQRRLITRSCSLDDRLTRSATFHGLTQNAELKEEEGSQQRRITVASYLPQSTDQNGNFSEKDVNNQESKSLREMNTDEVCEWISSIGLQKCLPFIRESKLCGADIASVDLDTLEILQISTLEDRELLLSAIYNKLHPPSSVSQRLDSLLESIGPENVEAFTATLVSMSKSKSSPHQKQQPKLHDSRNSQLIEITINASERIVHLRTPKETTVGKIMDSCIKMLGVTEDKSHFILKEKQDSAEELPLDQQIGTLLTLTSENRQLELHMCKMEKTVNSPQETPEVNSSSENVNKTVQVNQAAKEERIKELNQQVDSLQNVILQVQELHHSLVAFCSELKNMDGDVSVDRLGSVELKQKLELVRSRLMDKRQSLQTLRDDVNNSAAHKKKQLDVRLLEKMKLNCQVFKEEISIVHLTRQVAHLQNALQESYVKCSQDVCPVSGPGKKVRKKSLAISSLSQLVSPQSPAMLLVVQENQNPDGRYGFTCCCREGSGLVVVKVDESHLCVDDRLVEVNGVSVINSTLEDLKDVLQQGPSAQIVVLRQPPPTLTSRSPPSTCSILILYNQHGPKMMLRPLKALHSGK